MDRFEWTERQIGSGERTITVHSSIRLYDGESKTMYDNGEVVLTTHRLLWGRTGSHERSMGIPLQLVVLAEEHTSFLKSPKVVLHLSSCLPGKRPGPVQRSSNDYIKLSFHNGGSTEFLKALQEAVSQREWEKVPQEIISFHGRTKVKVQKGIVGIERNLAEKQKGIHEDISKAFEDLSNLMNVAKDMVVISKSIATKIKNKQGEITEDETIQFQSYLLSLGIDDPVTRDNYSSESQYFSKLAKEIATAMEQPLKDAGGMLPLSNVYCRLNRARSFDLVSPEDLIHACERMDALHLPVTLKTFDSGLKVLQLKSHNEQKNAEQTVELLKKSKSLSADELARAAGIPVVLAAERLLDTERRGLSCRDDSVHGLKFYINLFMTTEG